MMSVYCVLFFCMQFSAAGSKYLRETQGWRNSAGEPEQPWVPAGCAHQLLRVLSSGPYLTSPWMKLKEITCIRSQVPLRLSPNRKKLLAAQSRTGSADTPNASGCHSPCIRWAGCGVYFPLVILGVTRTMEGPGFSDL